MERIEALGEWTKYKIIHFNILSEMRAPSDKALGEQRGSRGCPGWPLAIGNSVNAPGVDAKHPEGRVSPFILMKVLNQAEEKKILFIMVSNIGS